MDFDVSVVVRAYNAEPYLETAAQDVLSQEGVATELVLVDDCSSDSTARLAAELSLQEPERVRVISHMEPLGRLESYRSGLRASHAPTVLLMDADDRLAPNALGKLLTAAREADADVVVPSVAALTAPTEGDITHDADSTDAHARVISPLLQSLEGDDVTHALFRDRTVPVAIKGRLYETALAKRAFAEVEQDRLAEHDEAAACFVLATKASRMVVRPDLRSLTIAEERNDGPMPVEEFRKVCANRATAEVVVDHLNRTEEWERFFSDWEGLALMLCEEAVSLFPDGLERDDLPQAADALLDAWGAPYVAAAAADLPDTDLAQLAIALSAAPSLAPRGSRPEKLCILVRKGDDVTEAVKLYDALAGRRTSVVFITEPDVELPQSMTRIATLPPHDAVLARARSLASELEKAKVDGLVLREGPEEGAYDELVARVLGMPVALLADGSHEAPLDHCALAPQVALATNTVPSSGVEAELWSLLGTRIGSLGGLVSQMALGTTTRADSDSRTLAAHLVRLAREQDREARRLSAATDDALDANERLTAENAALKDRIADLEARLEEACTERDELHASLDAEQNSGVFQRVFRRNKD